ncbi:50S ribosomal protein L14e [Candidatus Woesearchaeota archaeon]|nr:50S ribosomal protein L14e [Candidatus Woesearchaeota archaeon]
MLEVGRVCVKIAGRDAGKKCIIVDILDNQHVLIDGETRRKKCNTRHLEPLAEVLKIKKKASHEEVKKEFEKFHLAVRETKPKKAGQRPQKRRKGTERAAQEKQKQGSASEKEKKV